MSEILWWNFVMTKGLERGNPFHYISNPLAPNIIYKSLLTNGFNAELSWADFRFLSFQTNQPTVHSDSLSGTHSALCVIGHSSSPALYLMNLSFIIMILIFFIFALQTSFLLSFFLSFSHFDNSILCPFIRNNNNKAYLF